MAEFQEVMRQRARMCTSRLACAVCPLCIAGFKCEKMPRKDFDYFEEVVMDWAAKNPEPRYPTWREWQNVNFPNAVGVMSPCAFMQCPRGHNCNRTICAETPIPADIAQKLGIKPIAEKK